MLERLYLIHIFKWSGDRAIMDYVLPAPQKGEWRVVLDTDGARFGGFGRQDDSMPVSYTHLL